jgi:acyl dehydratase
LAADYELPFTTENSIDVPQQVLPTYAAILGQGGHSRTSIGDFDPAMLLHGEQGVELLGPIPAEGSVRTTATVTGIYDKGSGALVVTESTSIGVDSGQPLFRTTNALFIRGEGGFGGDRGPSDGPAPIPDLRPDRMVTYATRADQALLYRLSGDRNPLHSDPVFAKRAGFDRPILHGLCTYGVTGRALLHTLCGSDPGRFRSMHGRFSRPTYPGDVLTVSMWIEDDTALFRTVSQRGETVIDNGVLLFG